MVRGDDEELARSDCTGVGEREYAVLAGTSVGETGHEDANPDSAFLCEAFGCAGTDDRIADDKG